MSSEPRVKRITTRDIRARKGGTPIVCLTAYSAPMARVLDPLVDLLLIGDSLGMVLYGLDTPIGVSLETMIAHGAAVARGAGRACVILDLPFGSYQESPEQAYRNSARVMAETGCAGVKLEGGQVMAETVAFLTARGIPVLGHIGLTPQSYHTMGGFRTQGKEDAAAARLVDDGRAIAEAGAFAIVVEGTVEPVARDITAKIEVPTIGIGASPACDGQILVTEDILNLSGGHVPRFVKCYADLGGAMERAVADYAADVRAHRFPGPEHCAGAKSAVQPAIKSGEEPAAGVGRVRRITAKAG